MNVATIEEPAEQAKKKLEAYKAHLQRRHDEEYERCVEAYEAMAQGLPLINIEEAIRGVGLNEKSQPLLAIARADRKQVYFEWNTNESILSFSTLVDNYSWRWKSESTSLYIQIDMKQRAAQWRHGYSLVPMIPADVRPKAGQAKNWFILWEVEQWADKPVIAEPDRDPYLLKHIGGPLYAILAEWELTDLERSIMAARAHESN